MSLETGFRSVDAYFALARRDLAEMFGASAELIEATQSDPVRWNGPTALRMRLPGGSHVARFVRGPRVFREDEASFVRTYAETLEQFSNVPTMFATSASDDVLTTAVIARCVEDSDHRRVLEQVVRLVIQQSTKTYEGSRIAVNVCVDFNDARSGHEIVSFFDRPWAAVLGSGISSAIVIGQTGSVVALETLPQANSETARAPEAFTRLAEWTGQQTNRVALAATRTGEVYLFVDGAAAFVRRSSRWRGLPLGMLSGIGWISGGTLQPATKEAVLLALLDASAAHHGACIGIVRPQHRDVALAELVSAEEQWASSDNPRRLMVHEARFGDLSRRHRLELLSMDGATLLDRTGNILAAGAILQVEPGSTGGGRTAAAKMLARYGVGIKVSQDGPVVAYSGQASEEAFRMG